MIYPAIPASLPTNPAIQATHRPWPPPAPTAFALPPPSGDAPGPAAATARSTGRSWEPPTPRWTRRKLGRDPGMAGWGKFFGRNPSKSGFLMVFVTFLSFKWIQMDANLSETGWEKNCSSLSRGSAAVSESSCAMLASRTQKTTCKSQMLIGEYHEQLTLWKSNLPSGNQSWQAWKSPRYI